MRVILSTSAGKTIWYGNGKTLGSGSFPMKHWFRGAALALPLRLSLPPASHGAALTAG